MWCSTPTPARVGVIRIERAVVRVGDGFQVTTPKSDAGTRDVAIPPHLVGSSPSTWPNTLGQVQIRCFSRPATVGTWRRQRSTGSSTRPATRPTGPICGSTTCGTPAPCWPRTTGATLAELMARLGHSTPQAAMRYQHAAQGRDEAVAANMSLIALGA